MDRSVGVELRIKLAKIGLALSPAGRVIARRDADGLAGPSLAADIDLRRRGPRPPARPPGSAGRRARRRCPTPSATAAWTFAATTLPSRICATARPGSGGEVPLDALDRGRAPRLGSIWMTAPWKRARPRAGSNRFGIRSGRWIASSGSTPITESWVRSAEVGEVRRPASGCARRRSGRGNACRRRRRRARRVPAHGLLLGGRLGVHVDHDHRGLRPEPQGSSSAARTGSRSRP